jgi:desumoylating isopeptidase 1
MLSSWSQASRKLIDALPTESLFPMIDLWRLLVLDPAAETWMASQPNFDQHPLSLLLAGIDNTIASTSRNYILTALRLFANVFASPLIALKLVLGPQRQKLTAFIIQTLLHDDVMVKNASASLIFNYSAALQRNRVESTIGTTMQSKSIQIDEDEDWEVEIVSAIIEALKREEESEDFGGFTSSTDLMLTERFGKCTD